VIERDIIVVGAGPAGAAISCALAQHGLDVLLLDRASFPRDKTCGDAIPAEAVRLMRDLGMAQRIDAAVEREELYAIERLLLVSPRGIEITARFDGDPSAPKNYIGRRLHFDAILQSHAVASGVDFRVAQVTGPILEDGNVVGVHARLNGQSEGLRAKLVIGADGVTSVIARKLRTDSHSDRHRAVALRAYLEGIEELPRTIEFYLYKEISPGYAWIFPMGDGRANLGLGMRLDKFRRHKGDLKAMLNHFLGLPDIEKRLRPGHTLSGVKTWPLNFGSQSMQRAYSGALLVGDAAGLIDPLTGGGIYNALLSARIAADVVKDAFDRGDFSRSSLAAYDARCDAALGKDFQRSFHIQRMLLRFPFLVDALAKTMHSNSRFAKTFLEKL
jgi:geranylgeranyl reductase family protein